MDFKNTDLHVLIRFISELTGKHFIVDNRVGGNITMYSSSKLSLGEAYIVFESVLKIHKFVIVPSGNAYKILPMALGKLEAHPIFPPISDLCERAPEIGEYVTQVFRLKHSSAQKLSRVLSKTVGGSGIVIPYAPSNALIVTAPSHLLFQITSLLRAVDQAQLAPRVSSFPLQHGDAKSVAACLKKLLSAQVKEQLKFGRKSMAMVLADERTNVIVAVADAGTMQLVETLVKTIDVQTPAGNGYIHTLTLENAKAEDVADVMNLLLARKVTVHEQKLFFREAKIVADIATNSLLITAHPDTFALLASIIQKLDTPRSQVFIEAAVIESSGDSSFNFGVNWSAAFGGGNHRMFSGANHGGGSILLPDNGASGFVGFPAGSAVGTIVPDAFSIGGTSYSIQSIVSAVRGDNAFTILSTPQLLTLDNEEAHVDVVDTIPFVTQTVLEKTGNIATQSFDYKDVGVKLKITPRIGLNSTLFLKVTQEVSRVVNSMIPLEQGQQLVAPTTRKRKVETTLRMVDGGTAVIAGLLSSADSENNSATPWLSDVPVLGWFFTQKKKSAAKTNLYIFISARIINTVEDTEWLSREKRKDFFSSKIGSKCAGLPIMSEPRVLEPVMLLR